MRHIPPMNSPRLFGAAAFLSLTLTCNAGRITVIGDSLTKEYQITFPGLPGLIAGIDALNPAARNWAEILHERRNADFDSGTFKNSLFNLWTDLRLLGHEYNWAVPGATARSISLLSQNPDDPELLTEPNFATFTSYASDWKETPARISAQVQSGSSAAVIWCGGNDLRYGNTDPNARIGATRITYETIYEGDGTGTGEARRLTDSILAGIQSTALFLRSANPNLPIAICAVPHIGTAPEVKAQWPTDPVRTARITEALDLLNSDLKAWTEGTLGAAWVDTYTEPKALLTGTMEIGGVSFINASDAVATANPASAHNRYLFSHDGFHPGTPVQARIAQMVQASLKATYPEVFGASPDITDREVIVNILGLAASSGFDEFMVASGAPAGQRGPDKDPDGDGLKNILEFALAGNNPMNSGIRNLPVAGESGGAATLTWMPRFDSNIFASVVCQQSTTLGSWTDVPAAQTTVNPDGSVTAAVTPPPGGTIFLRLRVDTTP